MVISPTVHAREMLSEYHIIIYNIHIGLVRRSVCVCVASVRNNIFIYLIIMLLLLSFIANCTVFGLDLDQISIWYFCVQSRALVRQKQSKKKKKH